MGTVMSLTIEYWIKAWDKARSKYPFGDFHEGEHAYPGKTLNLLAEYTAYSKSLMALGWHKNRVGASLHFFSKRRSDQYTVQVENAIANFYHIIGTYALDSKYHTVEFILARVKQKMGNTPLNSNDNLAKILDVIRFKTTVDYASLNVDVVLNRYDDNSNTTEPLIAPQSVITRPIVVSNQRNNITASLARYLDGFQNESFSDAFKRLAINTEETRYTCPVSLGITDKPVRIDGILFDYSSLLELPLTLSGARKNPVSKDNFYLDQIQPDRDCKTEIEALIQQYEVMPKHGK